MSQVPGSPHHTQGTLFTAFWKHSLPFESHNLVAGPCRAVYFQHINLNLAKSRTYYPKHAYVLPIAYLTHGLPLIVYNYIYTYIPTNT